MKIEQTQPMSGQGANDMTYPEHIRQEAADRINAKGGSEWIATDVTKAMFNPSINALCATIEELHAAKAELAEAREQFDMHVAWASDQALAKDAEIAELVAGVREALNTPGQVQPFRILDAILAKYPEPQPDPLMEIFDALGFVDPEWSGADGEVQKFRAKLSKRGLEIREARHEQ